MSGSALVAASSRTIVLTPAETSLRGVTVAAPPPPAWPSKDPADVTNYAVDFAQLLPPGATITQGALTFATGTNLQILATAISGTVLTLQVAGGIDQQTDLIGITITSSDGERMSAAISLPIVDTSSALDGVQVISAGTTSSGSSGTTAYTLPAATSSSLGGVEIGAGIAVTAGGTISVSTAYDAAGSAATETVRAQAAEGSLSVAITAERTRAEAAEAGLAVSIAAVPPGYTLPAATATTLGGVKQGANVTIGADGTLSVAASTSGTAYTLPVATAGTLGGVKPGAGVAIGGDGTLSVSTAYDAAGAAATEATRAEAAEATIAAVASAALPKAGGTMTGALVLAGDPTAALNPVTLQYLQSHTASGGGSSAYTLPAATSSSLGGVEIGAGISVTGGGVISVSTAYDAAGSAAAEATRAEAAESTLQAGVTSAQSAATTASATAAAALPKAGGTMTGALILAGDPTAALNPVTLQYLQSHTASGGGGTAYTLPAATSSSLGGVEIGAGISVTAGGMISVSTAYDAAGSAAAETTRAQAAEATLTSAVTSAQSTANTASAGVAAIGIATTSKAGLVEVGAGISVTSGGVISVSTAYDAAGTAAAETTRAQAAESTLTSAVTSAQSTANTASAGVAAITVATTSKAGLVEIGSGISVTSGGVISVSTAYDAAGLAAAETTRAEAAEGTLTSAVTSAQSTASAALPKAGGTMTGALILAGDPTSALNPVTLQYLQSHSYSLPLATSSGVGGVEIGTGISVTSGGVISVSTAYDAAGAAATVSSTLTPQITSAQNTANTASSTAAAALPKAGGTMTGALVLAGDPTSALNPVSLQYLQSHTYALPAATTSALGGVEVGSGLAVTSGGILSVPVAGVGTLGEMSVASGGGLAITSGGAVSVSVGTGLTISGGALTVSASASAATTVDAIGTTSGSTTTINLANGAVQTFTVGSATQLAFTGWGASGTLSEVMLEIFEGSAYALTWPVIQWISPGGVIVAGTAGAVIPSSVATLQASASSPDFIYLFTMNGGSTIYGKVMR